MQDANGGTGTEGNCETHGSNGRNSARNGDWSQMILDKLEELQPVEIGKAAARIMRFIPFSYVARNGNGSALRAARRKLHSLKECNRIQISEGVITVKPVRSRE